MIQELMLPNADAITQFKALNDVIDLDTLDKYRVRIAKCRNFVFFKGKLYKFKDHDSKKCKVLNIKYCHIEMMSIPRLGGTLVFGQR